MKDVKYDFVQLGKWSTSTLKANIELNDYDIKIVSVIERLKDNFQQLIDEDMDCVRIEMSKRTFKMSFYYFEEMFNLIQRQNVLKVDYNKYQEAVKTLK